MTEGSNKRNLNREGRNQIIPICRWYDLRPGRPEKFHQKTLKLIKTLSKVAGSYTKISSISYTKYEQSEKETRKIIPFTMPSSKLKFLQMNLKKEAKDLYNENYKSLKKEINRH
jgi:hypothetical protein